jgi:hypothetical protein
MHDFPFEPKSRCALQEQHPFVMVLAIWHVFRRCLAHRHNPLDPRTGPRNPLEELLLARLV